MTPRSPLAVGAAALMTADARRITLKRAAEVDLDDAHERVEGVRSVLAEHLFREHDAGRIDDAAQRAELRLRPPARGARSIRR